MSRSQAPSPDCRRQAGCARADEVSAIAASVEDPELPGLTLGDLGIFRSACVEADGSVGVELTPTYSGCPATEVIIDDVRTALAKAGMTDVTVTMQLSPPWTTDWITAEGSQKLAAMGIAPPPRAGQVVFLVRCPQCGSRETEMVSRFSGTACKALHRCLACLEPFEAVKAI
ncbi:MAG TPA: 1,2-phenylacetyl-CoA epoxidase subunit PaaD [Acidimicrobiales bacterium]|nr:1,2-phenylacetyl-CoA epoxidase subunit PaaD [Acidimicrobiales bacterium]